LNNLVSVLVTDRYHFRRLGDDRMVWPLGVVVSAFRPTSWLEGRRPHHHDKAFRRWCGRSFIFDLWSRPWGVAGCWVSMEFLHATIPRKGSGSTTTDIIFLKPILIVKVKYRCPIFSCFWSH